MSLSPTPPSAEGVFELLRDGITILYALPSIESRTTLIGIGALPDLWRLTMELSWGGAKGAKRSEATDVKEEELRGLEGDGSWDVEIGRSPSGCRGCLE